MRLRNAWLGMCCAVAPLTVFACGEVATPVGSAETPVAGSECRAEGEEQPAEDGCNTCVCADGSWACTDMACDPADPTDPANPTDPADPTDPGTGTCSYDGAVYEEGESFPATDGCNTCSCMGGQVLCTAIGCPDTCEPGDRKPADDGCNRCECIEGFWACTEIACPPPDEGSCSFEGRVYAHGETFTDAQDCNSCTCENGSVSCTLMACPCDPGDTKRHSDGCNTCSCTDPGQWACTEMACEDVCSLPPETGPCRAMMTRFYYDTAEGECRRFTYGGCEGNANNFETQAECERACGGGR